MVSDSKEIRAGLSYIGHAGGSPLIERFDEDFDPVGPALREQMKRENLVYERDGKIFAIRPIDLSTAMLGRGWRWLGKWGMIWKRSKFG